MAEQPASLESVFLEALEKGSPPERAAFLDGACAGDAALRRRIEALLKAYDDAGSFLENPPAAFSPRDFVVQGAAQHDTGDLQAAPTLVAEPAATEPVSLEFLGPAQTPGRLGTLGPYEIDGVIGRGGMGVVLRAHDPRLDRRLAIKVLAPGLATNATARQRFLREARAAAAVHHEHVVAIHAIDEIKDLPFLVMECVEGPSLQQRIDRAGPLSVEETVHVGQQVASGLAAAHERGLIHRDIKPANILLVESQGSRVEGISVEGPASRVQGQSSDGRPSTLDSRPSTLDPRPLTLSAKLTDFGLARAADDASITKTGMVAGTPQYMSPEQAHGQPVDQRSDLFSLGSVLYAMCTARPPFRAETSMAVMRQVCDDPPPPIRDLNPNVPHWLAGIIERLMEKEPERRFQSAAELDELLGRDPAELQQLFGHTRRRQNRRRLLKRGLTAAALVAIATCSFAFYTLAVRGQVEPASGGEAQAAAPSDRPLDPSGNPLPRPGGSPPAQLYGEVGRITSHGELNAMAVSPDGKVVYSGGTSGVVTAWEIESGKELFQAPSRVYDLDISPDGAKLAGACGDRSLRIWDAKSGAELVRIQPGVPGFRVAFSPDGRHVGAALSPGEEPRSLVVYDAMDGDEIATFSASPPARWHSLAFSPDGRQIAGGTGDGRVVMFDAKTGKQLKESTGYRGPVWCVRFSRDAKLLFFSENTNRVYCWRLGDDKRTVLAGFSHGLTRFVMNADETLLVANGTPQLRLRDLTINVMPNAAVAIPGHAGSVKDVAILPGGRAVSCAVDGTVRVWKLPPPPGRRPPLHREDPDDAPELLAVARPVRRKPGQPDARTAPAQSPAEVLRMGVDMPLLALAVSPDGETVYSAGGDSIIHSWNTTTGEPDRRFEGHDAPIWGLALSPDGTRLASCGADRRLRVWDTRSAKHLLAIELPTVPWKAAFSPDGRRIAATVYPGDANQMGTREPAKSPDKYALFVFEPDEQRIRPLVIDRPGAWWPVAWSPDGTLIAAGNGASFVALFDADSGKLKRELKVDVGPACCVRFSDDGARLYATDGSNTIFVWNVADGRELTRQHWHIPGGARFAVIRRFALSPDQTWLAADGAADLRLRDLTGQVNAIKRLILPGHQRNISDVAILPDGRRVASCSYDGTVRIWKLPEREPAEPSPEKESPQEHDAGNGKRRE